MTPLFLVLSGFLFGSILTVVATVELVVKPMRKKYQQKIEEAVVGWGQTLLLVKEIQERIEDQKLESDETGAIISPIQFGREGS